MPTTIRLTTMPGKKQKGPGYTSLVLDLFGSSLGAETISISRVHEVALAVRTFGKRIRAANPDASFKINVSATKGQRKPPGFDAAHDAGQFGDDVFMHFEDEGAALDRSAGSAGAPAL